MISYLHEQNDDFNFNVDPFANTSTEDPFSTTEIEIVDPFANTSTEDPFSAPDPFSSSEKPPDPFASKLTPNMVDDPFAPTQTSESPAGASNSLIRFRNKLKIGMKHVQT